MAKAEQQSLQQIFHEARLNVPRYQRSYAWTETEVADLLEDITYVIQRDAAVGDSRDVVHYFGTIVLDDVREIDSPTPNDWTLYNVVDGQQRLTTASLLVGCLCEELQNLNGIVDVDTSRRNSPDELYQQYRDLYVKYRNKQNGRRFKPARLTKQAYSQLVVAEKPPGVILDKEEALLPARRLAEAKQVIQGWLEDKREAHLEASLEDAAQANLRAYFDHLYDVLSAIDNIFEVTKYEVDDAAEAGRLFEVVNDRGKDLTIAEKIKSHLLYCAGEVEQLDSENVARDFNDAVETITLGGGDEELVDQFVKRHWEMFTGETKRRRPHSDISDIHRRIKQIDRYASLDRPEADLADWINRYVESLREAAEAFNAIYDPERLGNQYDGIDAATLNKLTAVDTCGAASTFRPLLMAAYLKMDVKSDDFADLVRACEVFAVRAFEIMNRSTMLLRRQLKRESHRLFIADWTETDIRDLFDAVTIDDRYSSVDNAVTSIIDKIDTETGNRAPESDIIDCLTRGDVISGEFNRGWGGFGNGKNTVLYLLYEYERSLRSQMGTTGLHTLVGFGTFVTEAEIEHIAPQNPDVAEARLENHNENRHRLANLAFLWPQDNKTVGNDTYERKYNKIYKDSKIAILEHLSDPADGWDLGALNQREDELVKFVLERWAGHKRARVLLTKEPTTDQKAWLREEVQAHYSGMENGNTLPTIVFETSADGSVQDKSYKRYKPCSSCGGLKMELDGDDFHCACGTNIRVPNYQVSK
ncbi:hypothetical protein CP556_05555 [Natrinema sp. CBA1119]|uniref:DUF262 domain-containing protein n=1 Tax=Natrinema sp. CBA1119 TaxID=1608465 RepID=UPI000BF44680|nr:DUF262 domain-containing protein [Natrinema sp. CBA1119]PGF15638.1 hypothetical protein CP556_05555 [Natrinema sp. CBA1119]